MLLITITRLKLTHCHQLRAGRAKFHHSTAHYSDIAALGGIKRIICHSPLHVISQISELRLILLSGSDHRNQHWPDTKGLLTGFTLWWQTPLFTVQRSLFHIVFTGRAPGRDWAGTVFMFTGGPTRLHHKQGLNSFLGLYSLQDLSLLISNPSNLLRFAANKEYLRLESPCQALVSNPNSKDWGWH